MCSQNFTIKIDGVPQGEIFINKVKNADSLTVEGLENPKIVSFRITGIINNFEIDAYSDSCRFSKKQKEIISNLNVYNHKVLYIDKIKVKTKKNIFVLPSKKFILTNRDKSLDLCEFANKKYGSSLTYKEIKKHPYVEYKGYDLLEVKKFTFGFTKPGFDYSFVIIGNKLPNKLINELKNINYVTSIYIENILVKTKSGDVIKVNDLFYKFKKLSVEY